MSSWLHVPMPDSLSLVRLYARQPSAMPPANFFRLFNACSIVRGVWQSPQWPSPSTRYAPRFHEGVLSATGSKRSFGLYSTPHIAMRPRWLYGQRKVFAGVVFFSGGMLKMYALIASTSSFVRWVYAAYGNAG